MNISPVLMAFAATLPFTISQQDVEDGAPYQNASCGSGCGLGCCGSKD